MQNVYPKSTGVYHIEGDIECLELEIQLKYINSLLTLPQCSGLQQKRTEANLAVNTIAGKSDERHLDEGVAIVTRIKWQQKLLSPSEIELYKDIRNCVTSAQKQYHEWLKSEERLELSHHLRRKKKFKNKLQWQYAEAHNEISQDNIIYTYVDRDNFESKEDYIKTTNLKHNKQDISYMYVCAALKPDTELIRMRFHEKEHLLYIYPDFCINHEQIYLIEIDSDSRHLYAYSFINFLKKCDNSTATPKIILPENQGMICNLLPYRYKNIGLRIPPKRMKLITLLMELSRGQNFEYNNIHVRYYTNLPEKTIFEFGSLQEATHTCLDANANFNHTWELTLLLEEEFNPNDQLHIYFEVISIDSWGRERAEGYAHYACTLQQQRGKMFHQLQCVRPIDNWMDALRRYFIGGRKPFDYINYFKNKTYDNSFDSRVKCCMKQTGQLMFYITKIWQDNCDLFNTSISGLQYRFNVDDVRKSYRTALKRLEELLKEH